MPGQRIDTTYSSLSEATGTSLLRPDEHWSAPVKNNDECMILFGGDSLNNHLSDMRRNSDNLDFIVVNQGLRNKDVLLCKPFINVWTGPRFFTMYNDKKAFSDEYSEVFDILRNVDWSMRFYTAPYNYEAACNMLLMNDNIVVSAVPVNFPPAKLSAEEKFCLFDQGVFSAGAQSVAVAAIYLAVVARYKTVWLVGLDLTYGFETGRDCRVISKYKHHYGKEDGDVLDDDVSLSEYYRALYVLCRQLDHIQAYAVSRGVNIVNLSEASHCDSFPKGVFRGEVFPYLRTAFRV